MVRNLKTEVAALRTERNQLQKELEEAQNFLDDQKQLEEDHGIRFARVPSATAVGAQAKPFDWDKSTDHTLLKMFLIDQQSLAAEQQRIAGRCRTELGHAKEQLEAARREQQRLRRQLVQLPPQDQKPLEKLYELLVGERRQFFELQLEHGRRTWMEAREVKAQDDINEDLRGELQALDVQLQRQRQEEHTLRLAATADRRHGDPVMETRHNVLRDLWLANSQRAMQVVYGFFNPADKYGNLSQEDMANALQIICRAAADGGDVAPPVILGIDLSALVASCAHFTNSEATVRSDVDEGGSREVHTISKSQIEPLDRDGASGSVESKVVAPE